MHSRTENDSARVMRRWSSMVSAAGSAVMSADIQRLYAVKLIISYSRFLIRQLYGHERRCAPVYAVVDGWSRRMHQNARYLPCAPLSTATHRAHQRQTHPSKVTGGRGACHGGGGGGSPMEGGGGLLSQCATLEHGTFRLSLCREKPVGVLIFRGQQQSFLLKELKTLLVTISTTRSHN